MRAGTRVVAGFALVLASMAVLFRVSSEYFMATTFLSTSCMLIASYAAGRKWSIKPKPRAVLVGIGSASALFLVFLAGNVGISELHPFGIGVSSASSIYSLIASPSNPLYLQAAALVFDSSGYEAFFRGVLQARLTPSLGIGSAPLVAALDAAIHILTLNPLWVVTTFVADLGWGLTYHFTRDLTASFTSHLVWDFAIFIFFPIK